MTHNSYIVHQLPHNWEFNFFYIVIELIYKYILEGVL